MDSNHLQLTTTGFEGYRIPPPFSTTVDDHRGGVGARLPDPLPIIGIPNGASTVNVWGLNVDPWRNGSSTPVPSERARGKRRARTADLESPQAGPGVISEGHLPNFGGAETRPPMVGVKRGRSPGTADPSREKRARTDDKHSRRKHRSRGPPKIRRPDGPSGGPHSTENSHQSMPTVSQHISSMPIPGADQTRLDFYDITIPDATLSATIAPPQIHVDGSNLFGMQEPEEHVACAHCKDLNTGLQRLLSAVEEMKMGLHHMQDELRVIKTVVTPSQPVQAAERDAVAATDDVEMRSAVADQQDHDDEAGQQLPGAYSCTPTPASVPSVAEGEVNVHVARGRKVVFMLL